VRYVLVVFSIAAAVALIALVMALGVQIRMIVDEIGRAL
jgi:hypothetical protein